MIKYTDVRTITGTGALITVTLGFKPGRVVLINLTGNLKGEFVQGMTNGHMLKSAASAQSVITSNGISLTDNGYTIGTDAINTNTQVIYAVAERFQ